jgi:signal transduction histidine kinase
MNNNLAAIMGMLVYLEDNFEQENVEEVRLAQLACSRLKNKIDLLSKLFVREKSKKPVSVERLVKSSTFAITRPNLEVEYNIPEDIWPIEVVESQVSRIFENLFHNSIQAMDENGIHHGKITVKAQNIKVRLEDLYGLSEGNYVLISVSDNAGGVPAKLLPKIFDLGFTSKKEGKGIGLAFCKLYVERNNGRISVASLEGRGTSFEIVLPALSKVPLQDGGTTGDYTRL